MPQPLSTGFMTKLLSLLSCSIALRSFLERLALTCERVIGEVSRRSSRYLAKLGLVVEPGSHFDFFLNGCRLNALREFLK